MHTPTELILALKEIGSSTVFVETGTYRATRLRGQHCFLIKYFQLNCLKIIMLVQVIGLLTKSELFCAKVVASWYSMKLLLTCVARLFFGLMHTGLDLVLMGKATSARFLMK